jgi:hypothetical protein
VATTTMATTTTSMTTMAVAVAMKTTTTMATTTMHLDVRCLSWKAENACMEKGCDVQPFLVNFRRLKQSQVMHSKGVNPVAFHTKDRENGNEIAPAAARCGFDRKNAKSPRFRCLPNESSEAERCGQMSWVAWTEWMLRVYTICCELVTVL